MLLLNKMVINYDSLSYSSGTYTNGIGDASSFYNSWSGYEDELIWGAAWIAKATGNAADLARGNHLVDLRWLEIR